MSKDQSLSLALAMHDFESARVQLQVILRAISAAGVINLPHAVFPFDFIPRHNAHMVQGVLHMRVLAMLVATMMLGVMLMVMAPHVTVMRVMAVAALVHAIMPSHRR